jgi:transposase-like protein
MSKRRPSKNILIKLLAKQSLSAIAEKYGVKPSTVCKWAWRYSIRISSARKLEAGVNEGVPRKTVTAETCKQCKKVFEASSHSVINQNGFCCGYCSDLFNGRMPSKEKLLALLEYGLAIADIAKRYSVGYDAVCLWIKHYEIDLKSAREKNEIVNQGIIFNLRNPEMQMPARLTHKKGRYYNR